MKKFGMFLFGLAFIFAFSNAKVFAQTGDGGGKSDVFGYFSIAGKVPVAFKDIDVISLDGDYGRQQKPPTYGLLRLKNKARTDYALLKPTLNGKNLSFKTKAVGGVSYEFSGTLTRTDFSKEPQPAYDEIVLRGALKKMKGGKTIAESKVNFTWQLGD